MPVRSLHSAVLKWPGREEVLAAARCWARRLCHEDATVLNVYCTGSYARDDWGVGSDLDVIVLLCEDAPGLSLLERRGRYEPTGVPVPIDLWVYTKSEWEAIAARSPHLSNRLRGEMLPLC